MNLPPPLSPPEADLSAFRDMPLEVVRFAGSDLVSLEKPEAIVAALLLWGFSWHQRPAGSLTDDDRVLAKAAGYGRAVDAWLVVKEGALRGWIKCSDGRLYHPVVSEKVREAWISRLKQKHKNYGSAVRMHNSRNPDDTREAVQFDAWLERGQPEGVAHAPAPKQSTLPLENANMLRATDGDGYAQQTPDVTRLKSSKGREGKGREGKGYIDSSPPTPSEPEIGGLDLGAKADACCRLAGIPNTQPSAIGRNMDAARDWERAGVDFAVAADILKRWTLDHPTETVHSLRYFDAAVLKSAALLKAGHKATSSIKALAPLGIADGRDERIPAIRAELEKTLGPAAYGAWLHPDHSAMKVNGVGLVIKTRGAFNRDYITGEYLAKLKAVAMLHGIEGVEVIT